MCVRANSVVSHISYLAPKCGHLGLIILDFLIYEMIMLYVVRMSYIGCIIL